MSGSITMLSMVAPSGIAFRPSRMRAVKSPVPKRLAAVNNRSAFSFSFSATGKAPFSFLSRVKAFTAMSQAAW